MATRREPEAALPKTNPRGRVFLSYRRTPQRIAEAARVRDALRDRGAPTWRDLDDLGPEPTEDELTRIIRSTDIAGAIVLACAETRQSTMIRNVEAPEIFHRARNDRGFFVRPVLIGLDYNEVDEALGRPGGLQNIADWNVERLPSDSLTATDARRIAKLVLQDRLRAIAASDPQGTMRLGLFTRRLEGALDYDLCFDYSAYFDGRRPADGVFRQVEEALLDGAAALLAGKSPLDMACDGAASLPAAVLFGAVFSPLAGFRVSWSQALAGRAPSVWSHAVDPAVFAVDTQVAKGDPGSEHLVLALGVSANIESAVTEFVRAQSWTPRALAYVQPQGGPVHQGVAVSPGEGLAIALHAVQQLRALKDELRLERAHVHLFLACPLAMAMLIGQKLNTMSQCSIYEHMHDGDSPYLLVHTFRPSDFAYPAGVAPLQSAGGSTS